MFGEKLSYEHIKVFGCLCYAHNNPRQKDKFGSKSRRCIFVGYPHGKKGWRLYDLDRCLFFYSRDVTFYEHVFPFADDCGLVKQKFRDAQPFLGESFDMSEMGIDNGEES